MSPEPKIMTLSNMKAAESSSFDSDIFSGLAVIDGRNPNTIKD